MDMEEVDHEVDRVNLTLRAFEQFRPANHAEMVCTFKVLQAERV